MKYERILSYVAAEPWAIHPAKLGEIVSVLAFRAGGGEFTAEEIQARIGSGASPATLGRANGGAVAIVPVRGTIAHRMGGMSDSSGGASTEAIAAMFRQAMADQSVGTVLLDVDSPGGTVTGLQELAAEIFAARGQKRIVAVANGGMNSAAYWIGSQADEIVGIPSASVGSIGIFSAHQDLSEALAKAGVTVTLFSAGKYKTEMLPFAPLTDEAKAFMQSRVDAMYAQFVKDVARGRGVSVSDVRNGFGEGRSLDAKAAKEAGLIDRIATMDETLSRVMGRRAPAAAERAEGSDGLDAQPESESPVEAELPEPVPVAVMIDESDRLRRMERF